MTRADGAHDEVLAEFFRRVWDPEATAESVARSRAESARDNPVDPGEEAPRFIVLAGGRVIGYVSTIPVLASCGGRAASAHWIKGLMVLPEHRNGPVGFMVLREAMRHVGDTWTFALAVEVAPRRLFDALGFADLGAVPEYMRLLRPGRVIQALTADEVAAPLPRYAIRALRLLRISRLHRPLGTLAGAAMDVWGRAAGRSPRRASLGEAEDLDSEAVDAVWKTMSTDELWAPAERTGAYLHRRYGGSPAYRFGEVRTDGGLSGLAVARRPRRGGTRRLGGIRVLTISEIVYPRDRPELGLAVVKASESLAEDCGADAVLCAATDSGLRRLLRRRAFLPVPSRMHFLVRGPHGETDFPNDLASWWVTRGDSGTDEVF